MYRYLGILVAIGQFYTAPIATLSWVTLVMSRGFRRVVDTAPAIVHYLSVSECFLLLEVIFWGKFRGKVTTYKIRFLQVVNDFLLACDIEEFIEVAVFVELWLWRAAYLSNWLNQSHAFR